MPAQGSPVRLHDLREGAATLAPAARADREVVQETMGHSSITISMDVRVSVLPGPAKEAVEAAAKLVPRQAVGRPAHASLAQSTPKSRLGPGQGTWPGPKFAGQSPIEGLTG